MYFLSQCLCWILKLSVFFQKMTESNKEVPLCNAMVCCHQLPCLACAREVPAHGSVNLLCINFIANFDIVNTHVCKHVYMHICGRRRKVLSQ